MSLPVNTRLRTVRSVDPEKIESFLGLLKYRVQIYAVTFDSLNGKHIVWYVPDDKLPDNQVRPSVDLEEASL